MSGVSYLGTLSVGGCLPIVVAAQAQLSIAIGKALPELKARIEGLLRVAFALSVTPPSIELVAKLQGALKLIGQIQAGIAAGVNLGGISLPNGVLLALLAELELSLAALNLGLDFVAELDAILGSAGVSLYTYSGRADGFGPAFSAEFASGVPSGGDGSTSANAIVLATTVPAAWASMKVAFRT